MALMRPLKPLLRPLTRARRGGAFITAARQGALRQDWRPRALIAALDASLARLKTDRVDAFLLHSPPGAVIAAEETARVLEQVLSSRIAIERCDHVPGQFEYGGGGQNQRRTRTALGHDRNARWRSANGRDAAPEACRFGARGDRAATRLPPRRSDRACCSKSACHHHARRHRQPGASC